MFSLLDRPLDSGLGAVADVVIECDAESVCCVLAVLLITVTGT